MQERVDFLYQLQEAATTRRRGLLAITDLLQPSDTEEIPEVEKEPEAIEEVGDKEEEAPAPVGMVPPRKRAAPAPPPAAAPAAGRTRRKRRKGAGAKSRAQQRFFRLRSLSP